MIKLHGAINEVINPDIIRSSFSQTGMYDQSYDPNKIISKHKVIMNEDEILHFVETITRLERVLEDKGQLSETAMTRPGLPESTIKDDKTLIQRRTVFLTNANVIREEVDKKQAKEKVKAAALLKASKKRKRPVQKSSHKRTYNEKFTKIWENSEEETSSSESDIDD